MSDLPYVRNCDITGCPHPATTPIELPYGSEYWMCGHHAEMRDRHRSDEWIHRSNRPSWHPDDCNGRCCWRRLPVGFEPLPIAFVDDDGFFNIGYPDQDTP